MVAAKSTTSSEKLPGSIYSVAQEVEAREPSAVLDFDDGFKRVDYRRATDFAAALGKFLEAA